jgi:hypothetical protein
MGMEIDTRERFKENIRERPMVKINEILFHLRWIFMSPEKRYVYLWNRTMRNMKQAYSLSRS